MDIQHFQDHLQSILDKRNEILLDTKLSDDERAIKLSVFDKENDELNQSLDIYFRLLGYEGFAQYEALLLDKADKSELPDLSPYAKVDQLPDLSPYLLKNDFLSVDIHYPTLLNGFENYDDFRKIRFGKTLNGFVVVSGLVKGSENGIVFVLPDGYIPSHHTYFSCVCSSGHCLVVVDNNGNVTLTGGSSSWTSLSLVFNVNY